MEVDLATDIHGSCNGTVSTPPGSMRITKKGSLVHVRAEEGFWRATFDQGDDGRDRGEPVGTIPPPSDGAFDPATLR